MTVGRKLYIRSMASRKEWSNEETFELTTLREEHQFFDQHSDYRNRERKYNRIVKKYIGSLKSAFNEASSIKNCSYILLSFCFVGNSSYCGNSLRN